jgi:hypothetical protein
MNRDRISKPRSKCWRDRDCTSNQEKCEALEGYALAWYGMGSGTRPRRAIPLLCTEVLIETIGFRVTRPSSERERHHSWSAYEQDD